jgi:hypothetical protein
MKSCLSVLSLCALLLLSRPAPAADRKDRDNLPGNANWDLKAFDNLFRVVRTTYDADRKQVRWTVRTRDGYRTADFVRSVIREQPFTFTFYDEADKELAVVTLGADDFRGIPRERLMREGMQLDVLLAVPSAMPRTKKVVLRRGRPDR